MPENPYSPPASPLASHHLPVWVRIYQGILWTAVAAGMLLAGGYTYGYYQASTMLIQLGLGAEAAQQSYLLFFASLHFLNTLSILYTIYALSRGGFNVTNAALGWAGVGRLVLIYMLALFLNDEVQKIWVEMFRG